MRKIAIIGDSYIGKYNIVRNIFQDNNNETIRNYDSNFININDFEHKRVQINKEQSALSKIVTYPKNIVKHMIGYGEENIKKIKVRTNILSQLIFENKEFAICGEKEIGISDLIIAIYDSENISTFQKILAFLSNYENNMENK